MEVRWESPDLRILDIVVPDFETLHYHSAAAISDSLVVIFGGKQSSGCVHDLSIYDTTTGRITLPDQDNTRCLLSISGHSTWVCAGRFFSFGGEQRELSGYVNDLWSFDFQNSECFEWTRHEVGGTWEIPSPREGQTACHVGESRVMMFGGANEGKYFNTMFFLDLESFVWSRVHPRGVQKEFVPSPRFYHSMHCFGNVVYLFGGWVESRAAKAVDQSRQVFRFDLVSGLWIAPFVCPDGLFPEGQASCSSTVFEDEWIVFFGGYKVHSMNDAHRLTLFNMRTHEWLWGDDFRFEGDPLIALHHPTITAVGKSLHLIGGNLATEALNHNVLMMNLDLQELPKRSAADAVQQSSED